MKESRVVSLNGLRMNAVETDPNGVIGPQTVFQFEQAADQVYAEYAGGAIVRGYLVGLLDAETLRFRYCQLESGGVLHSGASICSIQRNEDGLVQLIEEFEWESRPGKGRNVIQEF